MKEQTKKYIWMIVCGIEAICIVFLLIIFMLYPSGILGIHDRVYLTAESPDGQYIARIVWNKNPRGNIDSLLVVEEIPTNYLIIRFNLLRNRDAPEDIKTEFRGISWDGHTVVLQLKRTHYRGPSRFEIVGPQF